MWPFARERSTNASSLDGLARVLSEPFQSKAANETRRWDKDWMGYFFCDPNMVDGKDVQFRV